jgi:hypothetical protein
MASRSELGNAAPVLGVIGVAGVGILERELLVDAAQAGSDDGCEGQVGVAVGARHPVLEAQAVAVPDHAEGAGAVVGAPDQRVGANEPHAKRLYELTLGAKKYVSCSV